MLAGENGVVAELEISNSVALAGPYCTIYGDRGTLIYDQQQREIRLKYLDPKFRWPEGTASEGSAPLGEGFSADNNLPWVEETRQVEPDRNMWDHVEIELARHLFESIRNGIPFPIKNADGLEVVRITEIVKKQNPQLKWIG
jgi:predicted dehydrogenase